MKIKNPQDIPVEWKSLSARKKSFVRIRPSKGVEKFKVDWSDSELTSDPDLDVILIQEDGKEYPCKWDIFGITYEDLSSDSETHLKYRSDLSPFSRIYRKKGECKLVAIPEGVKVTIETLEGDVGPVSHPDYISIGPKGELYPNKKDWVDNNLEFLY